MNILITSAGRRTYFVEYIKKALSGRGLVHASNSEFCIAMQAADRFVKTPMIFESDYVAFLLDYCLTNKINAIISLFDIDLPILAKAKKNFKKHGIEIVVSDLHVIRICNDKYGTYLFLAQNGLSTPLTYIDLKKVKQELAWGNIHYPLVVKPRWGMGSIGIYEADGEEELDVFYRKVKKDILSTYLKYESNQDIKSCVIIQEKLNGDEYGLDILNDLNGNFAALVPKKKIAMRAGETDIAETIENDDLTLLGKKVSALLKHHGNLDLDCIKRDGQFQVLEMNCRFGGQYPFSHLAGANYPAAIICWLSGETPPQDYLTYHPGITGIKDIVVKEKVPHL